MGKSIYTICLDLQNVDSQETIYAKQGDTDRIINFTLRDGGKPFVLKETDVVVLSTITPEGNTIEESVNTKSGIAIYEFSRELTASIGAMNVELRIYSEGKNVITASFTLVVEARNGVAKDVTAQDSFDALDKVYARANKAIEGAQTATLAANDAGDEALEAAKGANEAAKDANDAADRADRASYEATQSSDLANNAAMRIDGAIEESRAVTSFAQSAGESANEAARNAEEKAYLASDAAQFANIEAHGAIVAAQKAYDATERANDAIDRLENEGLNIDKSLFANAITDSKSGEIVVLTDVSPFEHTLGVKARSKNILNQDEPIRADVYQENGWKKDNNDWVGLNAYYRWLIFGAYHLSKGQTITLSFNCEADSVQARYCLGTNANEPVDISSNVATNGKNTVSYTATEDVDLYVGFTDYNKNTGIYKISNIMLCYGTDSEFVPHIADLSTAKVQRYRKSLFDFEYKVMQAKVHRVESRNALIPTQKQVFAFSIDKLPAEFGLLIEYEDGNTQNKTLSYGTTKYFFKFDGEVIRFGSNSNCGANSALDGKVKSFSFWAYGQDSAGWDTEPRAQVELNTETTEYEPYTEPTTYPINADGTVEGVTSLYPTTTLIPDTEGIVLDVDYIVDTKKYIDNKFAVLAALIVNS